MLALAMVFALQGQEPAPAPPPTPEQQFEQLLAEYNASPRHGVLTDAERIRFIGQGYRKHYEVGLSFVELAERNPRTPLALKALIQAAWQINTTPWPVEIVGEDLASGRALAILRRDHVASPELGRLCRRISWGLRPEYEPFLRAVLDGSPHPDVQGVACLSLAHYLQQRMQRIDLLELQPGSRKEFAGLFGDEYLDSLLKLDRARASDEIEALLERATKEFAAVPIPDEGTVGEKAAGALFELRHLCVGATAPEIEGVDQHGVAFKLSDYRGKVVLLDWWSWV